MSAFYDLASLVVVPSGYKASKVYAQKPLTTDGQLAFTRSTTATRVNSAGLIESVAINVPRLDYTNSTCPKLLLEPSRTNQLTYSSELDNAAWQKSTGGTGVVPVVTANNATAPDGTMTADTVVFNAGAGTTASDQSAIYQTLASLPAGTYTGSFYAKTASGTAQIMVRHAQGGNYTKFTITDQWQRFTSTEINSVTATQYFEITIRRGLDEPINASATLQLWGCQLEAGAYPTSLINTTTAAVTRLADECSKTGISSLIGQTEGTFFVEVPIDDVTSNHTLLRAGVTTSFANSIILEITGARIYATVYVSSVAQCSIFSAVQTAGNNVKVALAYKENDFALYINGVQIGTDNSGSVPSSVGSLWVGNISGAEQNTVKQALLFPTRLSNADLAALTA